MRALCPESWVVRTAWLYGAGGPNFVSTMLRLAGERETVSVVDDQVGQPTWTVDLADLVVRLVAGDAAYGTHHGTASGQTTWFGLARAVFEPQRARPRAGAPDDDGHLPAAGAAAGLERPVAPQPRGGGHRSRRRLAHGPSDAPGRLTAAGVELP